MNNPNSTSGIGEDIIRSIVQFGAAETHLKTLYEKTLAEMENGMVEVENEEALSKQIEKLDSYEAELTETAQLRRQAMLVLHNLYPNGDKDAWCLVKHFGIGAMTAFEAWQASDNDPELMQLWINSNKAFTRALTRFIGTEITDCAACLSDFLKAKGE